MVIGFDAIDQSGCKLFMYLSMCAAGFAFDFDCTLLRLEIACAPNLAFDFECDSLTECALKFAFIIECDSPGCVHDQRLRRYTWDAPCTRA